ncbi:MULTISPECIES: hypothetical protein [Bacillus]|nr:MULTISPECIES: hypothetical protein [Bacillus]MBK5492203.1 hypothetical protein [Bacillus sp. TH13]MDO6634409.1 hypothetical protein [Bacillus thuringiensis]MDO6663691.1 hypothetical protein [Bacillus thuringiensis]MDO6704539.1 hypothetical protein [Bacillus thuringiensis]
MKVICIEDAYMNPDKEKGGKHAGKRAFTKGQIYHARHYTTTFEDPWTLLKALRVTNDFNERHIIRRCYKGADNTFFETHFRKLENSTK